MGFIKDLHSIKTQTKEMGRASDPGARLREMTSTLQAVNQSMAAAHGSAVGEITIVSIDRLLHGADASSVTMTALVFVLGRLPVPSTAVVTVPPTLSASVVPGTRWQAFVNTDDPTEFTIDWTQPRMGGVR